MKSHELRNPSNKWDENDLVERLCHALDIAKLTLELLATHGYNDPENPVTSIRPEKIISETAILLLATSPLIAHAGIKVRVTYLAEYLVPLARSNRMMLGLCLEPTVAWDYALPHVCLSRLGYPDSAFDELLRAALDSESHAGRERVPHRVLEQEWIATTWNKPQVSGRVSTRTARLSILNHPIDVLFATREDIYAFTHALMYVTDFNLNPAPLVRSRRNILNEAEALIARCLDEQDYDLGAEVLLSWPLTGKSWNAAAAFAFRVLARVEDRAGFLPTPSTRISEIQKREGVRRTQYLAATAYHTAYVMGLLCALSLQPGHAPPAGIPAGGVIRGTAKQLLRLLATDRPSPHWYEEYQQLSDAEADALASFLLNVAVRRRVVQRDLEGVRALLNVAYDLSLPITASVRQAAELLHRFATYVNVGGHCQHNTTAEAIIV